MTPQKKTARVAPSREVFHDNHPRHEHTLLEAAPATAPSRTQAA